MRGKIVYSTLLGGLKNGVQKFDRSQVGVDSTMAILAVIALSIPSFFNAAIEPDTLRVEELSVLTAVAMIIIYGLSLLYSLRAHPPVEVEAKPMPAAVQGSPQWDTKKARCTSIWKSTARSRTVG